MPPIKLFLLWNRRSLSDTAAARKQHETLRRLSDDAATLQRLSNSSQVCWRTAAYLSKRVQTAADPSHCIAVMYDDRSWYVAPFTVQAHLLHLLSCTSCAPQVSALTSGAILHSSGSLSGSGSLHRGSQSINSAANAAAAAASKSRADPNLVGSMLAQWGAKRQRLDTGAAV